MTDPQNASDTTSDASAFAQDGGLNSSDTADWANQKSPLRWPMIVLFGLPMVILAMGMALMFVAYNLTQKPAATKTDPTTISASSGSPAPLDKDAQIAQLQAQIASLQSHSASPGETTAAAVAPTYADPTAVSQLSARLDRVEANQRALVRAASSAYAARALQLASSGPQPFISELAVVEPTIEDPALIATLKPYAEKGVPSVVSLAIEFPRVAAKANVAAKATNTNSSVLNHLRHVLGSFVSIRRTDNISGQGAEATLLHAETLLDQGDLKGAVAYLGQLKPEVQKAIKPWLDQAKARVLIDDTTRRISETALNRLSQMNTNSADTLNNGGVL